MLQRLDFILRQPTNSFKQENGTGCDVTFFRTITGSRVEGGLAEEGQVQPGQSGG